MTGTAAPRDCWRNQRDGGVWDVLSHRGGGGFTANGFMITAGTYGRKCQKTTKGIPGRAAMPHKLA